MNKKSQVLTLAIILGLLITISFVVLQDKFEQKYRVVNYVGDLSTGKVYYLKTTNPNCDFNNITISKGNIIYFRNLEETEGFELDENCR